MHRLIQKNSKNQDRIFPYIGGEEVNDSPNQAHRRYVINFGDMREAEARSWPDLMRIVEEKVKPARAHLTKNAIGRKRAANWWLFGSTTKELHQAIHDFHRVLVNSEVGNRFGFLFLPPNWVFAHTLNVFAVSSYASFCAIQSRPHELWARLFGSSMKDDLRYTPTDCFEPFPFPDNFETDEKLEAAGKEYYEFRAALMVKNNEGLTKTYNRFHDPNETSAEIKKLRELHAAMDRAVLGAYGWTDLQPTCDFFLDYEEEDEEEGSGESGVGHRKRKKPYRYRWPDEFRDVVLARLLELNKQRAEQEKFSGAAAAEKPKKAGQKRGRKKSGGEKESPGMFDVLE
jgi:hypothetical protein